MKKPLSNVADSVRSRLLNLRTNSGDDYNELLVRFCLERLLYRLSISAHRDRFILKGAMLFAVWQGFMHRRTRDLDLAIAPVAAICSPSEFGLAKMLQSD